MSKLFASRAVFALLTAICLRQCELRAGRAGPAALQRPVLLFKRGLSLGAPLTGIRAKLQAGKALTIVALGSSSTTGFGTGRAARFRT